MKASTVQTFRGLAACAVHLYSSSYSDDSRITIRDTNSEEKLELEGLTNAVLRGAVLGYIKELGYRKEDEEAAKFLRKLSAELTKALPQEVVQ